MSAGAGKSGNPCDRLTAPWMIAWRVISRMTDSVKWVTFWPIRFFMMLPPNACHNAIAGTLFDGSFDELFNILMEEE